MDSPADECVRLILRATKTHAMIRENERTLAAVSGGPDSMCLLYALKEAGYALEVAHLDHQTREGQSAEDAAFVAERARALGVPFHTESRPVAAEARAAGLGFEEYARKARYDFLKRTARKTGCAVIATGHHADDQAETILMRVLRGAAPRGLGGIPPVREEDGVRIVRPLIDCTREQVLSYLRQRGIPFRSDRSNANLHHVRNRVRHELLPLLREQFNPRVEKALLRLGEAHRCEDDLLSSLAADAYRRCIRDDRFVARGRFAELHPALQRRVLLMLAWRHGIDCHYARVVAATTFITEAPTGKECDLGGGVMLHNGRDVSELMPSGRTPLDAGETPLQVPGVTCALGKQFEVVLCEGVVPQAWATYCNPSRQVFDADAVGRSLTVRHRRPGDRFIPLGMSGSKKLKDYFADCGVPGAARDREMLLLASGRIIWVVGRAIAAEAAVTPATQRIIEVSVTDAPDIRVVVPD